MKFSFNIIKSVCSRLLEQNTNQLNLYKHRYKSRQSLLKLDENMLNDIGITKAQAEEEARKPFWVGSSFKAKQDLKKGYDKLDKRKLSVFKVSG